MLTIQSIHFFFPWRKKNGKKQTVVDRGGGGRIFFRYELVFLT